MQLPESLEIVVADPPAEEARVKAVVHQASQDATSLFVARFLTDLYCPEIDRKLRRCPWVVLRQYGSSCWVNAASGLADTVRAELGLGDAREAIRGNEYSVVLLSQVLSAVNEDLLSCRDLEELIGLCRPRHRLILTGDGVPTDLATVCRSKLV